MGYVTMESTSYLDIFNNTLNVVKKDDLQLMDKDDFEECLANLYRMFVEIEANPYLKSNVPFTDPTFDRIVVFALNASILKRIESYDKVRVNKAIERCRVLLTDMYK